MVEGSEAPEGYHSITPAFAIKDAPRLLRFLKEAFGAKETTVLRTPTGELAHAEVVLGDSRLMLGEATTDWPAMPGRVYYYLQDVDTSYKRAIEAGATSITPPTDQFYGDRTAAVKDPVGNVWTLATRKRMVSDEEAKRLFEKLPPSRSSG